MKNRNYIKILSIFFAVTAILVACEKEDPVTLEAQMDTWNVRNITSTSAEVSGIVVAEGAGNAEYGVCWSTTAGPTVDNSKLSITDPDNSVFWIEVAGLEHLTTYYTRAYVITSAGAVTYGEETSFTTLAHTATISATAPANITSHAATMAADVTYDGKAAVTAKGVCWGTEANPTISNNITTNGDGIGAFTADITGLFGGITYYARAYATNSVGTAYTDEFSFTTPVGVPSLNANAASDLTKTSATISGRFINDNGADVTAIGFVWGTTADPTTGDNVVTVTMNADSTLSAELTGLDVGATYNFRVYATNSAGTAYSENIEFTTLPDVQKLWLPGGYQAASGYTADWSPADAPFIMNTTTDPIIEGYVYFASANSFKFTTAPDWAHTNYGVGATPGTLDPAGDNLSVSEAGLYRFRVDLVNLTYTAEKVDWRLIGDAVGGWGDADEIDMVYNTTLHQVVATATMSDGSFKFRANRDWGINYGDNGADGTVEYGGDNIGASAGTYTVMLDLATKVDGGDEYLKLDYTYTVTSWGIIGDAVGGWSDDIDMTPDVANNTWTYTGAFSAGSFKFRANDGWDINYGGSTDALVAGGDNLTVDAAGNYTVVLNLATGTYTITPAK